MSSTGLRIRQLPHVSLAIRTRFVSRFWLPTLLVLVLACPVVIGAQQPDPLENHINRGLAFLKTQQEPNGAWRLTSEESSGMTGLAVMAFLSAGHLPGEGPYGQVVEKGIRYVLRSQQPSGLLGPPGAYEMYQHGICTLMLAESAGMADAKLSAEIRKRLEKAVALLLKAQNTTVDPFKGGWRYYANSPDADLSVTGWQILALKAAKNVGCDVPSQRIDLAMGFIRRCWDAQAGGFSYMPQGGGPTTASCTGTGILALQICGNDRTSKEVLQGGSYLLKNRIKQGEMYFYYSLYYGAQATFQLGKNYWNVYRPYLHKELFDSQQRNGSWLDVEGLGPSFGTSMSILALTVEYRFLPVYQRPEE